MGKNNKPYDSEYVKQFFTEKNCILLSEYTNSNTSMRYICVCGEEKTVTFNKFMRRKHGCRTCNGIEKYSQEYVQNYLAEHNCRLLSRYEGANTPFVYKCECGETGKNSFWNFRKGQRCLKCGLKKLSDIFKLDIAYVRQYFVDHNCTPLFETYEGVHIPLLFQCECGNISKIAFADFQSGKRCNQCRVERIQKTMRKNGTQMCSLQQKYIHEAIGGELNYPFGSSTLDIAFPKKRVYVEYNGSGHDLSVKLGSKSQEDFNKKEVARRYSLYRRGWKAITINSKKDNLPNIEKLNIMMSDANQLLISSSKWVTFDIDNNSIEYANNKYSYDFGKVMRIRTDRTI